MYSQLGTKIGVAGIIVSVLALVGIQLEVQFVSDVILHVLQVVGDIAIIVGTVKQSRDHKTLAQSTGTFPQ